MDDKTICPLCQSASLTFFEANEHADRKLQYKICRSCGLVLQTPQPDEKELERFYQEGYRTLYQETEDPIKKDLVMQGARAKVALEMIRPWIKSIRRHLDLGSSSGAFLRVIQAEYGNEAVGVEPGDAYRRFSEQQGLKIYPTLERLPQRNEAPFDLISMMHVLEHFKDPVETLSDLRERLLSVNGYLLLEVPNLYEHEAFEFAHLFAFTPSTLSMVVRKAGFRVLWVKAHGGFRSPILKLYLTLLAQSEDNSSRPLRFWSSPQWIKLRRTLGQWKRAFFTRQFPDWTWQSPPTLWEDED
jgi:SAM-dependent methyltransferase